MIASYSVGLRWWTSDEDAFLCETDI